MKTNYFVYTLDPISKTAGHLIVNLPDGQYSLRKPRKDTENWNLQVTSTENSNPLLMDLRNLAHEKLSK